MSRVVRIGTRASALARVQTNFVAGEIRRQSPSATVEIVQISTQGDRTQHTNAPAGDWGQGVFVKELEAALLEGSVDLAVHSLKDVPPEMPAGLALVAIPKRADPGDVLVTREGTRLADLPAGARVGTSSVRRAAFLRAARPDLAFLPIRGNVDTRCRKLRDGDYDAIVLAAAGLDRLGLQVALAPLDSSVLLPAPGQGALAIEARADDDGVRDLVAPLHDPSTAAAVTAERRAMELLGGGCRLPVAALATPTGDGSLDLTAAVAAPDGSRMLRAGESGSAADPEGLAEIVARRLLEGGAARLLAASEAVGA